MTKKQIENRVVKALGHLVAASYDDKFYSIRTVWPFNFFPDSIILDENKLTVIRRGFLTKKLITVQLEDLFNVEILEVWPFCTVRVIGKYVTGGHEDIPFVFRKDAYELHKRVTERKQNKTNSDQSGGQ